MINIQDIIPFMRDGYVAMDKNGNWHWFIRKPYISTEKGTIVWTMRKSSPYNVKSLMFMEVAPADDWTKSLIKVGENEKSNRNNIRVTSSLFANIYIIYSCYKLCG